MGDISKIVKLSKQCEQSPVMEYSREDLIKMSENFPCQILSCACVRYVYDDKSKEPWFTSICQICEHRIFDHISQLKNASDKILVALMSLIEDFEYIHYIMDSKSKLHTIDRRGVLLEHCKNFLYDKIMQLVNPNSISIKASAEIPPFQSPTIIWILKNFCFHVYLPNTYNLKLAFEITKLVLKHFDQWVWCTPEELLSFDKSQYMYSYEYYYQRYQKNCLIPNSIQSMIKSNYTSSMIFGQDVLKYTLKVFRISFDEWCLKESRNCSFAKKIFYTYILPKFLDLLEYEVYAFNSPIWGLNYINDTFPKQVLDNLNSELNEMIQYELNGAIMSTKIRGRIDPLFLVTRLTGKKYLGLKNNDFQAIDEILDILKTVNVGVNPSLKNFIKEERIQIKPGIEMIVFDGETNCTKSMFSRKMLRNMYLTQLPRLPDPYISRLETDKKIKTIAILEDGVPVGGIYFYTYESQGFTEIILCLFKVDLHVYGYEAQTMIYLKDFNMQHDIWDLLVYADRETFGYFKNHNFSPCVKLLKTKYNKCITHYENCKLMHCSLKKK